MKRPTLAELIEAAESKVVTAEWDRRGELLIRFNGLSASTLNEYQKEMESIKEFKDGIIKPSPSVTWFNVQVFIWYLKWKEANRYLSKKIPPKEILNNDKA